MLELYNYQIEGANFLKEKRRAILSDEMGVGKTAQAIRAADLINAKNILVICPNTLKFVWKEEIEKWTKDCKNVIIRGLPDERKLQILIPARFHIINYEGVSFRVNKISKTAKVKGRSIKAMETLGLVSVDNRQIALLKKCKYDLIICDEAHKLKNRNSRIFNSLKDIIKDNNCPIYFLTGTPIMNRVEEIWTILYLIDPVEYRSYWRWVDQNCITKIAYFNSKVKLVTGLINPDKTKRELSKYMLRRLKKDVLELPEKIYQDIPIEMTGKQQQFYDQMKHELYVQTKNGIVEATIILTKLIRLKQIATAPELLEDKNTDILTGEKIDALMDIIEGSNNEKVVIFSQFAVAIKALMKMFTRQKINWVGFTGVDNEEYRRKAVSDFQNNSDVKVFLATIQTAGLGITLTAASIVVFLDLLWCPANNNQAVDRLHRVGLKHPITVITLTAKNSIEEYIQKVLKNKQDLFDAAIPISTINKKLLDYLKEGK